MIIKHQKFYKLTEIEEIATPDRIKTDKEYSLVCRSEDIVANTLHREDGWRAFRIKRTLAFSMIELLADNAISTFQTDYVLAKKESYQASLRLLKEAGLGIVESV